MAKTRNIQHELSPRFEKKLSFLFKKGLKIYLLYIIIVLSLMIIGGIIFYNLVFKPVLQKQNRIFNQAEKIIDSVNKDFVEQRVEILLPSN